MTCGCVRVDPVSGSTPVGQPGLTSLLLIMSHRAIGVVKRCISDYKKNPNQTNPDLPVCMSLSLLNWK